MSGTGNQHAASAMDDEGGRVSYFANSTVACDDALEGLGCRCSHGVGCRCRCRCSVV